MAGTITVALSLRKVAGIAPVCTTITLSYRLSGWEASRNMLKSLDNSLFGHRRFDLSCQIRSAGRNRPSRVTWQGRHESMMSMCTMSCPSDPCPRRYIFVSLWFKRRAGAITPAQNHCDLAQMKLRLVYVKYSANRHHKALDMYVCILSSLR